MFWKYALWMTTTALYCLFITYICHLQREKNLGFWWLYVWLVVAALIPTWSIAAYYSTNIIFDSIFFQFVFVSLFLVFTTLFEGKDLSLVNYSGLILALIGLVLVKV